MTTGADGNVWFAESNDDVIGRITTGGVVTQFHLPSSSHEPRGIATGPDGAVWFTETGTGAIGRIDPSGSIAEFPCQGRPDRTASPRGRTGTSGSRTWNPIPSDG